MQRIDLYTPIHKGLRALLTDAARLAARADFADPVAAREAARETLRVLAFLGEHAEHEDAAILPVLAEIAPELARELADEHARLEGQAKALAGYAQRLLAADELERVALGTRLHQSLWRHLAAQLTHMDREEVQAHRALAAHRSDAELLAIQAAIVAPIPPARMAEWMEAVLPALSPPDRAMLTHADAEASGEPAR